MLGSDDGSSLLTVEHVLHLRAGAEADSTVQHAAYLPWSGVRLGLEDAAADSLLYKSPTLIPELIPQSERDMRIH